MFRVDAWWIKIPPLMNICKPFYPGVGRRIEAAPFSEAPCGWTAYKSDTLNLEARHLAAGVGILDTFEMTGQRVRRKGSSAEPLYVVGLAARPEGSSDRSAQETENDLPALGHRIDTEQAIDPNVKTDFLVHLAHRRLPRSLTCLDLAARKVPCIAIGAMAQQDIRFRVKDDRERAHRLDRRCACVRRGFAFAHNAAWDRWSGRLVQRRPVRLDHF